MNLKRQAVTFTVEVAVPLSDADNFRAALTGDDNDVVLAAERAIRQRLDDVRDADAGAQAGDEEVELRIEDEGVVKEALSEGFSEYQRQEEEWR
jgi:hypothetical protein